MSYLKRTGRTPTQPFYAINVEGQLHPCQYEAKNGKYEAFIYGKGWRKSKKAVLIPAFDFNKDNLAENFNRYLKEYGDTVLFYALTGYELNSNDCVISGAQDEFKSAINFGFDYIDSFYKRSDPINEMIDKIMWDKWKIHNNGIGFKRFTNAKGEVDLVSESDLFEVSPCYRIAFFLITAPHIDVIIDDNRLWKLFVSLYSPKTDVEYSVFPVSPKDRLTFLFNEEVSNLYEKMLNDFTLDVKKKQRIY